MQSRVTHLRLLASVVCTIAFALVEAIAGQNAVNPDATLMKQFEDRVADYLKVHKQAESKLDRLKKPTDSPTKIRHYQHELREAIRSQRPNAQTGNIFTPETNRKCQLASA
jgi:hypothetical protein